MNPLFIQELQELYSIILRVNSQVTYGELLYAITRGKKPQDFLNLTDIEVVNLIREAQLNETEH